jgi:phthiocerol/phenolphthiocerol synthesis type-I polyketide synthase D
VDPDASQRQDPASGREELQVRRLIAAHVADLAGLPEAEVDPDRPLAELGLSSRDAVILAGYLEALLGQPVPSTVVWEHPTISDLARLVAGGPLPGAAVTADGDLAPVRSGDAMAVIGIGCRFPGGASGPVLSPGRLWRFLLTHGNAVREIPAQRWAWFWERAAADPASLPEVTRWAAVLDDVAGFDAAFFGISPAEATTMDPQQRMLLEVSWEALEHAGLPPRSLAGSRTGVFTGISAAEYAHLTAADPGRVDAWTATGAAASVAAGRISYLLDFRGPSLAVDTACSSSLVAVHLAAASLRAGECDLALAGGVNLLLSPVITMAFDAGGGTSPDGRCRPFDAAANGMVRGEGCGVVVLKRLADARRDGDRVLAVLAGSAVGSDGRSNGLVAPNGEAQRDLLRNAYAAAGVDPASVGYVEAHGTGTPLGDPVEARALGEVLGLDRPAGRPLLIGSVKSNIGHLEAAAGVAGLIKAVLALSRRQIPPTAHFAEPSPHIAFGELGLAVPAKPVSWPAGHQPPRAGVSAFGFSGTNAHIVLEAPGEPRSSGTIVAPRTSRPASFVLCDVSPDRVRDQARQLARCLDDPDEAGDPADVAATLAGRAGRGSHRAVVVGGDHAELTAGLTALGSGQPHPAVVTGAVVTGAVVTGTAAGAVPGVVFVFSGYGSQWPGMGRLLAEAEPAFAAAIDELDGDIRAAAGVSLRTAIRGDPAAADMTRVEHAQPVLFGVQVALARLWAAYGIVPAAVIGHSMGEVAAAVVAGALTAADGARVIACRSRLLSRIAGSGAMALIGWPAENLAGLTGDLPDVHVAVISSPVQTVVTGQRAQIAELARRVAERGAAARVLDAEGAGHSPQVDPLVPGLLAELADVGRPPVRAAAPRFYSTVSSDARLAPACDAAYWAANMRQPVRLQPAVAAAADDGFRVFVEVAPHPIVGRALTETLRVTDGPVITGTLRRAADDVLAFHRHLAALTVAGIPARRPATGTIIDLPPAPWRHVRYWPEPPRPPVPADRHPLLGPHVELPGRGHAWSSTITLEFLAGLRTLWHGRHVFPLSAAAEMAAAAACEAWDAQPSEIVLTGVRLERLIPVSHGLELVTTLEEGDPQQAEITIHGQNGSGAWILAAAARACLAGPPADAPDDWPAPSAAITVPRPPRTHRVPAKLLDECLAAACGDPAGMPTAIGVLRLGDGPSPGASFRIQVRQGTTSDVRARTGGGSGPPVLEARGVAVTSVRRDQIPVPHHDKLLYRSWEHREASPAGLPACRRWVLLTAATGADGQAALAPALAAALAAAGHQAGPPVPLAGWVPDNAAGPPAGVVIIAPDGPVSVAGAEALTAEAVRVAGALAAGPGAPPRLWLVTAGAVPVRPGEAGEPGLAALQGLIRVLRVERPELRATLADADADAAAEPAASAAALAAELAAGGPDDEIAWRDGRRLVARLARAGEQPARRPVRSRRPVVRPGGCYLITGGYGGLGLEVARWLADRGAGRLVLAGRAGPPEDSRAALARLRARGAEVRVIRGDIAAPADAARLVRAATDGAPLCGVVHAAGVFSDGLIADVSPDVLGRVWTPKTRGALALHDAMARAHAEPDWMVLFSSAAALLGSPGQAAYATANAWLDGFAAWRTARGLPTFAIGWGTWRRTGRARDLAIPGIDPLDPDEAVADLEALLAGDRPVTAVVRIDPARAAAAFPEIAAAPFFASLLADGHDPAEPPGASPALPRSAGSHVRSIVAAVLGLPADSVAADLPLTDAGADSLAAQRITSLLKQDLGVTIETADILGGATLAALQKSAATALRADSALSEPAVEPRDAAERQVLRVAAGVLGVPGLGVTHDLRAAGLTHAAQREIAARLAAETGRPLDPGELLAEPTIAAVADKIRRTGDDVMRAGPMPLLRPARRPGPAAAAGPVLLAHPAGGDTGVYQILAGLLDDDRPVFGLERQAGPVAERAQRYSADIARRFPEVPCVIGGWSFGGVLGYETARCLTAAGRRPELVVLLDAALPLPVPPGTENRALARRFAAFAGYLTRTYGRTVPLLEEELAGLGEQDQLALLTERMTRAGVTAELSPAILRHQLTSHEDTRALERYQPGPYDGPVVLYRAERETPWAVRDPRYEITDPSRGWAPLCAQLDVVPVDAHHLNLLDPPGVGAIADHLRGLLAGCRPLTTEVTHE